MESSRRYDEPVGLAGLPSRCIWTIARPAIAASSVAARPRTHAGPATRATREANEEQCMRLSGCHNTDVHMMTCT